MKKILVLIFLFLPFSVKAKDLILFCKPDIPKTNGLSNSYVVKIEKSLTSENKIYIRSWGIWKDFCSYGGRITKDSFNCKFSKIDLSENFILDLVTNELTFFPKDESKLKRERWTCKEKE